MGRRKWTSKRERLTELPETMALFKRIAFTITQNVSLGPLFHYKPSYNAQKQIILGCQPCMTYIKDVTKKPLQPYQMFVHEKYPEVVKANPGLGQTAVFAMVAELWRNVPADQKKRYSE